MAEGLGEFVRSKVTGIKDAVRHITGSRGNQAIPVEEMVPEIPVGPTNVSPEQRVEFQKELEQSETPGLYTPDANDFIRDMHNNVDPAKPPKP